GGGGEAGHEQVDGGVAPAPPATGAGPVGGEGAGGGLDHGTGAGADGHGGDHLVRRRLRRLVGGLQVGLHPLGDDAPGALCGVPAGEQVVRLDADHGLREAGLTEDLLRVLHADGLVGGGVQQQERLAQVGEVGVGVVGGEVIEVLAGDVDDTAYHDTSDTHLHH